LPTATAVQAFFSLLQVINQVFDAHRTENLLYKHCFILFRFYNETSNPVFPLYPASSIFHFNQYILSIRENGSLQLRNCPDA